MDARGGADFESISAAATSGITSGAIIAVQGLTDPATGSPVAYSNLNFLVPTNGSETFPILLPHGVSLIPVDSTPVYIWPTAGMTPPSVIRVVGSSPDLTAIGRMNILGGIVGVDIDSTGADKDVLLRDVVLGRSGTNLSAIASGGATIDVEVLNCRIVDIPFPGAVPAPTLLMTSVGLRFNSIETTGGPPRVVAEVNNLTATGTYANLSGTALRNSINDLATTVGEPFSRLMEAYAVGSSAQGAGAAISEVILNVNGGELEGGATLTAEGWDIGIYSALDTNGTGENREYRAGTVVTATGASISNYVEAGIYGTADLETRGQIILRGKTEVFDTGSLLAHTPGDYFHSGVHLYCLEGYMGLNAVNATIHDNTGHGIVLRSSGTVNGNATTHFGMPLGLRRCGIYQNDGDGIALEGGVATPTSSGFTQDGIVGGTRLDSMGYVVLEEGSPGLALPIGQGVVDRCAISNNGERGVRAFAGDSDFFVYCRFVNTFIWNNPLGGFVGDFSSPIAGPTVSGGRILTPLLHCTLYGNGSAAAPYNIEFLPVGGLGQYFYADPFVPSFATATEIDNSIFEAPGAGTFDFGPRLTADAVSTSPLGFVPSGSVGVGGVRVQQQLPPAFPFSTEDPVSFVGPITLSNLLPNMLFLNATGNLNIIDASPSWINVSQAELGFDFEGTARTGAINTYDKGADEWQ
ncbi:MAG: hypothetical protein QM477_09145 [Planctomycetota bacterium]